MNTLRRLLTFLREVREELRRVAWPSREEVSASAVVVFVGVTLLAGYLYLCDTVLSKTAQVLLR